MTKEQLKKAKNLEKQIDEYSRLIAEKEQTYYQCLVTVNCANSNGYHDVYAIISREVFNKMLDVLIKERQKLIEELEAL